MSATIYIKNMVCIRCKMVVEAVLKAVDIGYTSVSLGKAELVAEPTPEQWKKLEERLKHYHLFLMQDKTKILIEKIKTEILSLLYSGEPLQLKLSVHLGKAMAYNYTYLANIFSEVEGMTLEKYFISQRVERAKELMVYEGMSLSQITDELAYSSVSHFCVQFKKVAGITPAEFKKQCRSDSFEWRKV